MIVVLFIYLYFFRETFGVRSRVQVQHKSVDVW